MTRKLITGFDPVAIGFLGRDCDGRSFTHRRRQCARFRTDPEAPVLRAREISHSLKAHPELRVRIGIRSGAIGASKKLLADLAPKDTR